MTLPAPPPAPPTAPPPAPAPPTAPAPPPAPAPPLARLLLVECPALATPQVPEEPAVPGRAFGTADDDSQRLRRFARMVEALTAVCPWVDAVRPGVCTLPVKGPTRYFGSEAAVLEEVARIVTAAQVGDVRLGVAEGLLAASLAARAGVVVPPGRSARFLAPYPVDVLGDPQLADALVRLGLSTLGRFAAVPRADVLGRFGAAGARCHRVARGEEDELSGYRVPGMAAQLGASLGRELALVEHQPGFWGGVSAADERAAEVLSALQRRLGPAAVVTPVLGGGRGPADRCRLVSWRQGSAAAEAGTPRTPRTAGRSGEPPWPGQVPLPAPGRVSAPDVSAEVVDTHGAPVGVSGRGLLTARPAMLCVAGGPWTAVTGWSAPWPVEERWWSRSRRRAARLQVLTQDGAAFLLLVERGRWRVEATYD